MICLSALDRWDYMAWLELDIMELTYCSTPRNETESPRVNTNSRILHKLSLDHPLGL